MGTESGQGGHLSATRPQPWRSLLFCYGSAALSPHSRETATHGRVDLKQSQPAREMSFRSQARQALSLNPSTYLFSHPSHPSIQPLTHLSVHLPLDLSGQPAHPPTYPFTYPPNKYIETFKVAAIPLNKIFTVFLIRSIFLMLHV